ncbi:hypothetical protein HD806DRAFT_519932 [Xylariaceae sp. AK1471]|nr:hypothetical protein HD806DRAFT_519932 [Xylariaceae sp. AK1471]
MIEYRHSSISYTSDVINENNIINNSSNESNTESNSELNTDLINKSLFTRTLLPINKEKDREILVQCTNCFFNSTVKIKRFQSSNFVKHYKAKYPAIAYNKKAEKKLTKKNNTLKQPTDFFNLKTKKRPRNNTNLNINVKDIINNNLSFNMLNSKSFKDLFNFLKPITQDNAANNNTFIKAF